MLEFVLVLPLLLFILLALLQVGMTIYAQSVVIGAAQEGARIAAQADKGIDDGIAVANRNITTGLGQVKTEVTGSADNEAVSIQVEATVPSFLPILNQSLKFNLKARANMIKEGWQS
jgi:Flp pilus assembly protein TadG